MPMGGQLTDQQIAVIKNWIDNGAEWESAVTAQAAPTQQFTEQQRRFWAFQPVSKPAVPRVKTHNPIDAFVLAKLEANKLKPNPPADRITLIRRAYLDLIGLPPSPEEVESFLADKSPAAFEKVVDKLLASPQYGERWGRHWLDVARYADTRDRGSRFAFSYTYRDWVIRALNEDM